MTDLPPIEVVRAFLAAVASDVPDAELERLLAPGVVQEEFPNRLVPEGAVRDLAGMLAARARGRAVIRAQSYEVVTAVEAGDIVAIESVWTGTLAIPLGALAAGDTMRARFAQFFQVEDGRIVRIRNYDCFDPW